MKLTLAEWEVHIGSLRPPSGVTSLERVRSVASQLDVLDAARKVLTIGGTNGKGSTALYAEAILLAQGRTVGTTISPHFESFNERIRLNGQSIADADLLRHFQSVEDARRTTPLTYFEFATLVALNAFTEAKVDVWVLEVGLGGRLDATNVVSSDVSVITNVALDHQAFLGSDREQIGTEKSGILRASTPFIFGEVDMPKSVAQAVTELETPVLKFQREFDFRYASDGSWEVDLFSGQQGETHRFPRPPQQPLSFAIASQAIAALNFPLKRDALERGLATRLTGRFEIVCHEQQIWVFDVAHNPAAVSHFVERFQREFGHHSEASVLLGLKADKDARGVYDALSSVIRELTLTSVSGVRAQTGTALAEHLGLPWEHVVDDVEKAVQKVSSRAKSNDLIVVVGSHDLVVRAKNALR